MEQGRGPANIYFNKINARALSINNTHLKRNRQQERNGEGWALVVRPVTSSSVTRDRIPDLALTTKWHSF